MSCNKLPAFCWTAKHGNLSFWLWWAISFVTIRMWAIPRVSKKKKKWEKWTSEIFSKIERLENLFSFVYLECNIPRSYDNAHAASNIFNSRGVYRVYLVDEKLSFDQNFSDFMSPKLMSWIDYESPQRGNQNFAAWVGSSRAYENRKINWRIWARYLDDQKYVCWLWQTLRLQSRNFWRILITFFFFLWLSKIFAFRLWISSTEKSIIFQTFL